MTILEEVGAIRSLIGNFDDDSKFSDAFLYSLLAKATSTINRIKVDKTGSFEGWTARAFPIQLEASTIDGISDCIPVGCNVLKSIYKIPSPVKSDKSSLKELIKVTTLDRREISRQKGNPIARTLSPVLNREYTYDIVNEKVVLYGGYINKEKPSIIAPKYIIVNGLWEDITQWATIPNCLESTETMTTYCYSLDYSIPIPADYSLMVQDYVLQKLGYAQQQRVNSMNPLTNENSPS